MVKREVIPKHEVKEICEELVFEQDPLQVCQGESAVSFFFLDSYYNKHLSCGDDLTNCLDFLYLLHDI